jgi:hypothetical protein
MPILWDESRFPLVLLDSVSSTTNADFDVYLTKLTATLGRQQTFGVLLDARKAERPTPIQRQRQAEWMKEHAAALKKHSVGMTFVMDNPIIRGSLTAILWLQPMPMPHAVFKRYDDAETWLVDRLTAQGVRVPPRRAATSG